MTFLIEMGIHRDAVAANGDAGTVHVGEGLAVGGLDDRAERNIMSGRKTANSFASTAMLTSR